MSLDQEIAALDRMGYWGDDFGRTAALYDWMITATDPVEIRAARIALRQRVDRYEGRRWLRWRQRRKGDMW